MEPLGEIKFRKTTTPRGAPLVPGSRCLFTISVNACNQTIDDLVSAYFWAKDRYDIQGLLVGDGLYRITLRICNASAPQAAREKAAVVGNRFLEEFLASAKARHLEVFKTSNLFTDPEFIVTYQRIDHLYRTDTILQEAVNSDAKFFVDRQHKHGRLKISENEAVTLSEYYIKQEIAVYLLMAERGWPTDIYLGQEIPTLAKIMNGEIPGAPKALRQRINVGLQKRTKKQVVFHPAPIPLTIAA
ncbi:MAG: hypothetical protein WBX25_20535 [Rhodomicrobium sp.]